jgi:DNA-binding GntR family transcriptional regulator
MESPASPSNTYRIRRQSLPETLADSLRERILSGEFKEGDQLVQEAIAEEYEVSRMPVREALRQLEASGLVELKAHRGAIVTSIPLEQVSELFELRALLECELLARAMPNMTSATFSAAKGILHRLETAYHEGDVSAYGRLNWDFHHSLYLPSNRVQTLSLVHSVNVQTDRYIRLQLVLAGKASDAEEEHRKLLKLCESGNIEATVAYLREHILDAGERLLKSLQNHRNGTPATPKKRAGAARASAS